MIRVRFRGDRSRSGAVLAVTVAVVAGLAALSCGGGVGSDSVVGPAPVQAVAAATDQGTVTASGQKKQDLCHYAGGKYNTLNLPPSAIEAHLSQHAKDYLKDPALACGEIAATCPCFGAADLAKTCDVSWTLAATCPGPGYSFNAFCTFSCSSSVCPPAYNLGLMWVDATATTCYRQAWDSSGNAADVQVTGLDPAQVAACEAAIVTSPYYPSSPTCP
jgi:hypothetical protein